LIRVLANLAGFQAAWWAAVLGAGAGLPWAGPAAGIPLLALHLGVADRSPEERALVLRGLLAGAVLETLNAASGVLVHRDLPPGFPLPPAWIVLLWPLFAATLRHSTGWVRGRRLVGAALGAAAGPLCCLAGERFGAIRIGEDRALALAALAAGWAATTALLVPPRVSRGAASSTGACRPGPGDPRGP
jgi:hypothetical protein